MFGTKQKKRHSNISECGKKGHFCDEREHETVCCTCVTHNCEEVTTSSAMEKEERKDAILVEKLVEPPKREVFVLGDEEKEPELTPGPVLYVCEIGKCLWSLVFVKGSIAVFICPNCEEQKDITIT